MVQAISEIKYSDKREKVEMVRDKRNLIFDN